MFRILLAAFLLSVFPLSASHPKPVESRDGMVVSTSALASEVGASILEQGGNAVDAAVAVGFALAVTYPSAGNLGGGGFLVLRMADGTVRTLDFRETAPARAHQDMYLDENRNVRPGLSTETHLAAGIPGTVDGLIKVLDEYGTMPLSKVITPAIKLAEKGFPLPALLAEHFEKHWPRFSQWPASAAVFGRDGKPLPVGAIWCQPDLAKTLARIREHGRNGFYQGPTAKLLVAEMNKGEGIIDEKDLTGYRSKWREPVHGTYRGFDVWSMPPPSSGGVLLIHMLNMLEPYDVAGMEFGAADLIHLMVEIERRAYADRATHLGDPDFVKVPMEMLLSKGYARQRLQDYDPAKASKSLDIQAGEWPHESPETTHFSVMDKMGNAVSCTVTLNLSYGSGIVVSGAGFLLNNEMDDFSIKPGEPNFYGLVGGKANAIAAGKRMLSSMTPTIVSKDGQNFLVTGSPGGSTIITTVFQVVINVLDHRMDISEAVGEPRFHHQWLPDVLFVEQRGINPDSKKLLIEKGHTNIKTRSAIGDANSILFEDGVFKGAADPRRYGTAVGN